ncbi:hypothetical protein BJY04DRAFT_199381 [Aspergillus karnatakaensis]|uniref:uncharacterized protein n=1 Tax=Aspergillus karnatakaensis TaxID=1810916 RepID=UPI003CCCE1A5
MGVKAGHQHYLSFGCCILSRFRYRRPVFKLLIYYLFRTRGRNTQIMPVPDHKEMKEYTEYIAFYAAKRAYNLPLHTEQCQKQKIEREQERSHHSESQVHQGQHLKQHNGGQITGTSESQHTAESLQKSFQRPLTPRWRTQSWSMEDQKHEFHRRLMNLGEGAKRGFSET